MGDFTDYCRTCDGRGGESVPGDVVPYGSTTAQLPDEFEPCPDCAEKGSCPRCGKPGLTSEVRGDDSTGDGPCRFCGWTDADGGLPWAPDCTCADPGDREEDW